MNYPPPHGNAELRIQELIPEQSFCTFSIQKRMLYAEKILICFRKDGQFTGILFNIDFNLKGLPIGGSKEEYLNYFSPRFEIEVFESCYNTIPPVK